MIDYSNNYEERCNSYSYYEKYIRGKPYTLSYAVRYMQRCHLIDPTGEEDMSQKETIRLYGKIIRESNAAILFNFSLEESEEPETKHQRWFPLSQVSYIMKAADGTDEDIIDVASWILKKDGLI